MDDCVIYDFETLGQDQRTSVVLSFAMITFSERHYKSDPYDYLELVNKAKFIKFDVESQVAAGRKINKDTLVWWHEQGAEAQKQLKPTPDDKPLSDLYSFIKKNTEDAKIKKSFTRGNTFDPMFLQYIMEETGNKDPFHWRTVRDTRSMIEGMSFGMKVDNSFTPAGVESQFIKHDPRHDIAMDVLRMQLLAQAILQ